jgi:hypothetical protein
MLYRRNPAVCSEIDTKRVNALCLECAIFISRPCVKITTGRLRVSVTASHFQLCKIWIIQYYLSLFCQFYAVCRCRSVIAALQNRLYDLWDITNTFCDPYNKYILILHIYEY